MKIKSVKNNFIFNSMYQISNILVPLVTLPYLSRVLHAEGLGAYSFAYSVAYYFYLFVRLGLNNYGNRTVAQIRDDSEKLSRVFIEIYMMQLLLGVIVTILYLFYCVFIAQDKLLAFIFMLMVISGSIDLTWMLYGLEEFVVTSIRDMTVKVATALLIFLLVKDAGDVWKYALIYSVGFFVSQVVALPIVKGRVHFIKPAIGNVIQHLKPNLILFLPTIAVSIYKTMDKVMLGSMTNDVELGYYHGCENITRVPLALVTALGTVMLPRMTNMLSKSDNQENIDALFNKSIMFAMFISTSTCIGIMTVAREFVPLFFGEGFEKCILLFWIILPSCIFLAFANVIRTQFLLPRKRDKLFVISLFSGAVINVILNLLLIPRFASVGAALGTLAAEIVVCVVQAACVFKEANIGRNILNSIPFVFSGIVMFVVFHNYAPPIGNTLAALVLKIVICGMLYCAVLGVVIVLKRTIVRRRKL